MIDLECRIEYLDKMLGEANDKLDKLRELFKNYHPGWALTKWEIQRVLEIIYDIEREKHDRP